MAAIVHTGSRGLGASILARQTANESNPYIPADSPHLPTHLAEHDYAVRWAIANRDLVAHRIKQCIFSPSQNSDDGSESSLSRPRDLEQIIDMTHNSVTKHSLTLKDETSKSSLTTTALGSGVVCTDVDLLVEERPEAYKDVGCVVDDMEDKGICKGVVVLRPVVTYKVREGGEGRK
jgi:release factor H-coupled RctB family protein